MATTISALRSNEPAFGFSTDVGDVSWCTPTMGCGMPTVPLEVGLHTWAATACHGTSIGVKGAISAARVLTATGVDIVTDADLRQAARADFERRTQGKPYVSPLGPEMEHPLEIPEWVLQERL
jgi:aminobenzoyl-glutamate utilization protein B